MTFRTNIHGPQRLNLQDSLTFPFSATHVLHVCHLCFDSYRNDCNKLVISFLHIFFHHQRKAASACDSALHVIYYTGSTTFFILKILFNQQLKREDVKALSV